MKKVESYLGLSLEDKEQLKNIELNKNQKVKGVKELLALILDGFDP